MIITIIETIYRFLWGDFLQIPLPGGGSVGISLLIILLIPVGIYFTIRTRVLPVRLFPEMVKALLEKKKEESSLSTFQTLIVSTATRVGMGRRGSSNLSRRSRGSVLDVDNGSDRLIYGIYRSNTGTALQGEGPSVRWLPGRSGLLYTSLYRR